MNKATRNRRVAVIGAGLAAGPHLDSLQRRGDEMVTVLTRSDEHADRVRARFPLVRRVSSLDEAFEDGVDLTVVLTPTSTHLDVVQAAAANKTDVIVEKPLEADLPRAIRLVETAETAGVGLAVCYQHRAKAAGRFLHDLVAEGALGDFVGGVVQVPWWRPQSYYEEPGRGTYARDGGGALITQAVHALDLFLWTVGPPRRVIALAGTTPVHSMEAEDTLGAILDYRDGRMVTLHATTAAFPGLDERIVLHGSLATAELTGSKLVFHPEKAEIPLDKYRSADPSLKSASWHQTIYDDALAAFDEHREPLASGRSALVTQQVVQALYDSAASGGQWAEISTRSR
jgi:UDP-N-acetyl-2-amino-2-deoxyglucuronate dehydrogenase